MAKKTSGSLRNNDGDGDGYENDHRGQTSKSLFLFIIAGISFTS